MSKETTVVQMHNISKSFGALQANCNISFDLKRGEIHALLGENGAGKSTLMNILYGIYTADEGEIFINGKKIQLDSPRDAIAQGVGMVHQHFMLVPTLTVLENIVLGQEVSLNRMKLDKPREIVQQLCDTYNFQLDLDAKIEDLSVGALQRVEIVKTLYRGADILILDEPTAVLTPQEVNELFIILKKFTDNGKSIILITHKLWEVDKFSSRVSVLRQGEMVGTVNTEDVSQEDMAGMMIGKKIILEYDKTPLSKGDVFLDVQDLSVKAASKASTIKNVSFNIKSGEIVGFAGVDGNGQVVLAEALMGLRKVQSGKISFKGSDITDSSTRDRMQQGFSYIPEDRLAAGLILDFSVKENCILNCYEEEPFTHHHVMSKKSIDSYGEKLAKEYDLRPCNPDAKAGDFSGGNQQKIVVAREFSRNPSLVIAMQPTRGLDIGSAQFVHHKLLEGRDKGVAICLISADLDEILAVSDRVLVMSGGEIFGEFVPGSIDYTQIGLMMGGKRQVAQEVI